MKKMKMQSRKHMTHYNSTIGAHITHDVTRTHCISHHNRARTHTHIPMRKSGTRIGCSTTDAVSLSVEMTRSACFLRYKRHGLEWCRCAITAPYWHELRQNGWQWRAEKWRTRELETQARDAKTHCRHSKTVFGEDDIASLNRGFVGTERLLR